MKKTNDQPLKEVLKAFANSKKIRSKLMQVKIKSAWAAMMGSTIGRYTSDINVRGNTVYITIDSSSLRQELSFGKEKIRKMLNEEVGEEYIQNVVIR